MEQKGFTPILVLVGIVILSAVAGGAYYFGKDSVKVTVSKPQVLVSPTSQPTIIPSSTPDEAADLDSIGANWKTYTNTENTFSFRYPPEMTTTITGVGLIRVEPINMPTNNPKGPTDTPGDNRIIKFFYGLLNGKTLKDLATAEYNEDKSGAGDKEVSPIILNGNSGYEYSIGGFRQDRIIYLQHKDANYIFISTKIYSDTIVEKTLSTFKFIP